MLQTLTVMATLISTISAFFSDAIAGPNTTTPTARIDMAPNHRGSAVRLRLALVDLELESMAHYDSGSAITG